VKRRGGRVLALLLASAWALDAAAAPPKVFIETEVDPHDPYVQAAARVTIRVYSARALYRSDLDLPAPSDVLVHQIGGDDHGSVRRDSHAYDVLTRRYLVFPQRSGTLNLPGAMLSAQILTATGRRNPFNTDPSSGAPLGGSPYAYGALAVAIEPLMIRGEAIVLEVRPRPTGTLASYWMPAQRVSLTSEWHPESTQAHVGDALTLSVAVQAEGLPAEQLPDVSSLLKVPQGLKAYPDEPKLDNANRGDTLVGRREQSIALIADQPGRFTLPALKLRWWDTARNLPQEVSVPARTVLVMPPVATPSRSQAPVAGSADSSRFALENPWRWVSLALALAWVATLLGWYGSRRGAAVLPQGPSRGTPRPGAARARGAFQDACRANDPRAARRSLLAWVEAEWPGPAPAGLNGMAKQSGDSELARLLRELDRACYAGGAWQGETLARALAALPLPPRGAGGRASRLAPLYH
jgi:hypothetical protein